MSGRRERSRATIKDVARVAKVSVTTASEALNGKPRVAASTRVRVEEVAKELGYSASLSARNLHAGRTGALALVVAPMQATLEQDDAQAVWDIDFYVQILNGANARAFQLGYLLSMVPFQSSAHEFLDAVDGVIVVDPSPDEALLSRTQVDRMHCVTVGRNTNSISWVDNDFLVATTEALDRLTSSRPGRPMFFLTETSSLYVRDELSAYLDWCFGHGIEPIIHRAPGYELEDAEPVIRDALSNPGRSFDSVVTTLDTLALATARVAHDLKLAVPDDLQILSLADSRYLAVGAPTAVTALDLQPAQLGSTAIDIIVSEIENGQDPSHKLIDTSLTLRDSTLAED